MQQKGTKLSLTAFEGLGKPAALGFCAKAMFGSQYQGSALGVEG